MRARISNALFSVGAAISLTCSLALLTSCFVFGVGGVWHWLGSPSPQPYANIAIGVMCVGAVSLNVGALLMDRTPDA
jgi:hypothetical protein